MRQPDLAALGREIARRFGFRPTATTHPTPLTLDEARRQHRSTGVRQARYRQRLARAAQAAGVTLVWRRTE